MNELNSAGYLKYSSKFFISEFNGTALFLPGGFSEVIFMVGDDSPMEQIISLIRQ